MTQQTTTTKEKPMAQNGPSAKPAFAPRRPRAPRGAAGAGRPHRGSGARRPRAPRSEFEQKIVAIRRVARVVAGGRRFSFSVIMVLGDKNGRVGVGVGKATDTALAIEKSAKNARKNMITVSLTKTKSIPHEIDAKFNSSEVVIMPAKGRGLVAGSSVRTVLDLAGVTDVVSKILSRSKNKLNNAMAALKALEQIEKSSNKK